MRNLTNMLCGIVLCLTLISTPAFSQEQLGLRLDNYSGSTGIIQNPAANATNPLAWDLNLGAFGAFTNSNLLFVRDASVFKVLKNRESIAPDPSLGGGLNRTNAKLYYDLTDKNGFMGAMSVRYMGPSFSINLKNGQSFGLFTGVRFLASSHNLPKQLGETILVNRQYNVDTKLDKFKGNAMLWSEYGFNYSYTMGSEHEGKLAIGGSLKFVQGLHALFAKNYTGTQFTQIAKDSFRMDAMRAAFGFTTNYDKPSYTPNGSGFGLDVGAVMTIPSRDDKPYEWRLGVSFLDMGKVTMRQNVEVHSYNVKESFLVTKDDFNDIDWLNNPREEIFRRLNDKAIGANNTSVVANSFEMGMPATFSVQADYAYDKNIFISGVIMQRLPVGDKVLERENILAIVPRYESRWISGSLSMTLLNYNQVRWGMNARLGYFSIGTENLGSYFKHKRMFGSDFYMALKVNPFREGFFGERFGGHKRSKKVSCYRF
jgi:hypothetical protein